MQTSFLQTKCARSSENKTFLLINQLLQTLETLFMLHFPMPVKKLFHMARLDMYLDSLEFQGGRSNYHAIDLLSCTQSHVSFSSFDV